MQAGDGNDPSGEVVEPSSDRARRAPVASVSRSWYPMPSHLTAGGLHAFRAEVARYAVALGAELERRAVEPISRGGEPEHTAEAVAQARTEYERRLRTNGDDPVPAKHDRPGERSDKSVLSAILLTVATVGVGVMPNFLHSPWQYGLFVLLIVVGVVGLGATWAGRRSSRGRLRD